MAESAAYARRGFKGGAKPSIVPAGVSNVAVALTGSDLSTWAGVTANGPFMFVLDPDTSNEEVCEATTIAGNVISGITRGLRGTSAVAHSPNCVIKHIASDRDFDEANRLVNAILGISGLAAGDLLYLLTSTTFARLPKGTALQALLMNAGATAPAWGDSLASLLTAKGMLPSASAANTPIGLAVGANGKVLVADSAAASGLKWDWPPGTLLGRTEDTSSGTRTTTSGTPTSLGAGSAVTFTAPASGIVDIEAMVFQGVSTTGGAALSLMTSADALVAGTTLTSFYFAPAAAFQARALALWRLTGLTPGTSYTYRLGHSVDSGAPTVSTYTAAASPLQVRAYAG